jgi:O-antigen/teichoic acid export membrane protein
LNLQNKKLSIFGLPNIFKNFFNIGVFQFAGLLLQLLAIPLITRKYGLEVFGEIALATSFAYLLGNIINYGTNQTEIKKISVYRDDNEKLSNVFFNTFWLRVLVFLAIITFTTIVLIILQRKQITLWLSITPFLFAEILNPIYFLIGIEKMHWISWGNVITRTFSFILILLTTINSYQSFALNLFMGLPLLVFYLIVVLFLIRKFRIKIRLPYFDELKAKVVHNFQVTFNGNIGMLQQSIFLFFVAGNFNTSVLGAYGIVDKLLNAIRQVVSAFSTAIYPRGAILFHESKSSWLVFRMGIQNLYFLASVFLGLFLYYFADQIVYFISSGQNSVASDFIKLLSPAPLFLSLNANNVLDFLLNEQYKGMFWVSIFILIATILISFALTSNLFSLSIGWYPLFIEVSCLMIYSIAVKKYKLHAI